MIVRQVQKKFQHFVVFRGELDGRVFLADPLRGNVRMPRHQFLERWDGKILAVAKRGFRPPERHPLQVDEGGPTVPENLAARRSLFVKVP